MVMAERAKQLRGRQATSSLLRLMAAIVALLLSASALGQAAHFLLVPHTICAEHGELLELGESASHGAASPSPSADSRHEARASQPEAVAEHDHCQVLARGQREQALPKAAAAALLPAAAAVKTAVFIGRSGAAQPLPTLALAPKTSPPRT